MDTNDKRPVWLLDVDGVINVPFVSPPRGVWPAEVWQRSTLRGFPILIAEPVLEFIRRMHASGLVEIRWHTTWQHHARLIEAEFGLPELPIQDAPEFTRTWRPTGWWKAPAAARVVFEENRPLVWTDDDLVVQDRVTNRLIGRMKRRTSVLTIAPHDNEGLTGKQLGRIEAFILANQPTTTEPTSHPEEVAA